MYGTTLTGLSWAHHIHPRSAELGSAACSHIKLYVVKLFSSALIVVCILGGLTYVESLLFWCNSSRQRASCSLVVRPLSVNTGSALRDFYSFSGGIWVKLELLGSWHKYLSFECMGVDNGGIWSGRALMQIVPPPRFCLIGTKMSVLWPSTPLGELTTLPRPLSWLERGHPSPYPTPLGTDPPSALAMRPPEVQPDLRLCLSGHCWNGFQCQRSVSNHLKSRSERPETVNSF